MAYNREGDTLPVSRSESYILLFIFCSKVLEKPRIQGETMTDETPEETPDAEFPSAPVQDQSATEPADTPDEASDIQEAVEDDTTAQQQDIQEQATAPTRPSDEEVEAKRQEELQAERDEHNARRVGETTESD